MQLFKKTVIHPLHSGLLIVVALMAFGVQSVLAQPTDATVVFFQEGKKRCHVADCKRYKKEDPTQFTQTTYKEAKGKGLELCSKCPGSPLAEKAKEE